MLKISKFLLVLFAAGCVASEGQAQQATAEDEKGIRNTTQEFQEAYNQQNAEKLSTVWAPEATFFNPLTDEKADGRAEIEKLFKEKFAKGKKGQLEISVNNIEFSNADEAIENGVMKVNFANQSVQLVAFELGFVKQNGKWLIESINEIELQEPTSNFEQLKNLEWLVGKWEDSDDNVQILFDNQWDKYKNFITQHFKMKIYEQDDIEGKQIIGWDPTKKMIRSWVFDSDGGFGEGTWEKVDKSWYETMHFTLSDGRIASSKNIYTPIDNHSYTYASVEREVDGEILPDMNPVKVEKME